MRLPLKSKLLLMVAIPLFGMLWVSLWNAAEKILLVRDMARMERLVEVSAGIGAAVHELQKERGMSSGFLGSKGANFAAELPRQREASDQKLEALRKMLADFDAAHYGQQLQSPLAESARHLETLGARRQGVTTQALTASEAVGYYNQLISTLLSVPGQAAKLAGEPTVTQRAAAYGSFLQYKERAGQERATLSGVFGADKFAPDAEIRFLSLTSAQDTWLAVFQTWASDEQRQFLKAKLAAPAIEEVARLRKFATDHMHDPSLGTDAKLWFKAATERIELLKEVESRLEGDLVSSARAVEASSERLAWLYGLGTLLSCAFVLVIALRFTRSISRQIGGEPDHAVDVAHAIAHGTLDNHIELAAGDQDSLLATMKLMQQQLVERIEGERRVAAENLRIRIALDNVSTGVMIADTERKIIYANRAVQRILKAAESDIRSQLPGFDASRLVGTNIDTFHKVPAHQARLLATFSSTHTAALNIGPRHMTVSASPVFDESGGRIGSVAEWRDRSAEVHVEEEVQAIVRAAVQGDFSQRLTTADKEGFFKELAQELNDLLDTAAAGLKDVADALGALARGDLTHRIDADYVGTFGRLKDDANATVDYLKGVVGQIKEATDAISTAAQEIAAGNQDLSSRTEEQASSLEETVSTMEELSATVKQNAENALRANDLARSSNENATRGGEMVKQVVQTMGEIQDSSHRITEIVGVIDSIAFQTNILALNAAVEAARAGEQGRGFAVVASEVRALALRSATAAKEIKALIATSVEKVEGGAVLVQQAGNTINKVVTSFHEVAALVTDITSASREQSSGIDQVTQAISQMDQVTQQNAALVEQAAAAAESLEEQSRGLVQAVGRFNLGHSAPRHLPTPIAPSLPRPANGKPAPARNTPPPAKLPSPGRSPELAEWDEF